MRRIINLRRIAIFGILILSIMACSRDDSVNDGEEMVDPSEENSIVDILQHNTNYSSFYSALKITELDITLGSRLQNYTVFVPNNAAFNKFLSDNGYENLGAVPKIFLIEVIKNHILFGELLAEDISNESKITTMALSSTGNSLSMVFNISGNIIINGNSSIITTNIKADNGIIHIVNAVIDLPDVTTILLADPEFKLLIKAFEQNDDFNYLEFLRSLDVHVPFIFFAPTNDAFEKLLKELEVESLGAINKNVIEAILKYHIVPETDASDFPEIFNTLETGQISMYYGWDINLLKDENNRESNVIRGFYATNGFIYKIDRVLLPVLPEPVEPELLDISTLLISDPEFEILIKAFNRENTFNYIEYLKSNGENAPFTMFAPTNKAFEALYEELEIKSIEDIPKEVLQAILKYHMVPKTNLNVDNFSGDQLLNTLETGQIIVRYDPIDYNYWVDENYRVDYFYPGHQASNGYIFKVNKVLLPKL